MQSHGLTYITANARAKVGTWVGLVQPGWLSLVQVLSARATSTRLALSMSVREPSLLAAKRALLAAWWCMCACW